jgi:hypothetical protein
MFKNREKSDKKNSIKKRSVGTLISGIKSGVLKYIKLYKYEFLLTSHFY